MSKFLVPGPVPEDIVSAWSENMNEFGNVGGQAVFYGRVRADELENSTVLGIEYSAYSDMVNAEFERIVAQYSARYADIVAIHIAHAVNRVAVGEIAMVVMVSGRHRKQAFEALPLIVDDIKANVPIWKKEWLANGNYAWTENEQ